MQLEKRKLQPCSDGNCAGNYCSSKFDYRTASIKVIKLGFERNWKFFSVSDTSKELLKDLDKDVTVEVVAETGNVDSRIEKFISIYGDLSSKLKVSYVDPVLHPEILTKYGISANSVVVSCEETGKNQVISFSDIIVSQQNYYGYSSESEF